MKHPSLVGALLVGLAACHAAPEGSEVPTLPGEAHAPVVEVLRVESAPVDGVVTATGTADAAEAADLASPAGGIVTQVLVEPGDAVREGQVLVRYRNERVSLGRSQASAAAEAAETQAAYAESELKRLRPLVERGSVARSELDALESQARAARANARAARSAARSAGQAAADLTLTAPFDGIVTAVHAQVGETATGRAGVRVADLDVLELSLQVHESDLRFVRDGATVEVHFPNLDLDATGTVSWVGLEIDARSRTAEVVARIDNADHSIPAGAFAEATLRSDLGREAMVVPPTALAGSSDDPYVWVVQADQATKQPVQVRRLGDGRAELLHGVEPGQVIVASRTAAVREGPVRPATGGER